MTPATIKRRATVHRRERHARYAAQGLRDRYGLGPHTMALHAEDLRDLVKALRIVAKATGMQVAAAIGCSERNLYALMPPNVKADRAGSPGSVSSVLLDSLNKTKE
jgi:hypothetical protein